jgi:hypothetical protein
MTRRRDAIRQPLKISKDSAGNCHPVRQSSPMGVATQLATESF